MSKLITEHLQSEDSNKKPDRAVWIYIISCICLFILFSLFFNVGTGGGRGVGEGRGKGRGHGNASGNGAGKDSAGEGRGIGAVSSATGIASNLQEDTTSDSKGKEVVEKTVSQKTVAKTAEKQSKEPEKRGDAMFKTKKTFSPFAVKIVKKIPPEPAAVAPAAAPADAPAAADSGEVGGGEGVGKVPGTGDISFRIYWTPKMHDIDLHVIDPNGHELFFQNKSCRCHGELDVDDTKHGGPENVFWPQGKAPHGKYSFYVVYYNGFGPKNVTLEVRKGDKIFKTYKVRLTQKDEQSKVFSLDFEGSEIKKK